MYERYGFKNIINSSSYGSIYVGNNSSVTVGCGFRPAFVAIQNQENGQYRIMSCNSYNLNNATATAAIISMTDNGFIISVPNLSGRNGTYHYVACQ